MEKFTVRTIRKLAPIFFFFFIAQGYAQTDVEIIDVFGTLISSASVLAMAKGTQFVVEGLKTYLSEKIKLTSFHLRTIAFAVSLVLSLTFSSKFPESTTLGFPYPFSALLLGVVTWLVSVGWYDTDKKNLEATQVSNADVRDLQADEVHIDKGSQV